MSSLVKTALSLRHKIVDGSKAAPGCECVNPRSTNSSPGSPSSRNADKGSAHTPVHHEDQFLSGIQVCDGGTDVQSSRVVPSPSEMDLASKGSSAALADNDGSIMAAGDASIQSTTTANVAKELHTHCDVIQLFMWFHSRDQNQSKQRRATHERALLEEKNRQLQHDLDARAAQRRHNDLLDCLESLKRALVVERYESNARNA
ncbi:hypothetical protein JG687_00011697 [Phytophthora cactorum]|uniref:Uncharacterized protein n=1 Tax=Phytophthora cactorum TaxID=29920 RepID=A0A329SIF7_9STRA|nr:hypothetical protein Pcac1_g5416 [Phytophthora cactorum]KAG2811198.1 hypothetical protein PC111_g15329 [Phytophthora cactorum]KAG2812252.1 hypothetical protein PC112_g15254 [Phytophthora cactorum]KAG2889103.1 hypothetical protein PC114_g18103 [Phytophthora cactorum]KAG2902435.1 hypothetical protein PC115_g15595 [Phytophthora cactorum]